MTRAQVITDGQTTIDASDDSATILRVLGAGLRNPAEPLSLLVRSAVEAGDVEKVEASFGKARSLTLNEPGCRAYELNRDTQNPSHYLVYERWKDLAALDAHLKTPHIKALFVELPKVTDGAPESQVLLPAG